MAMMFVFPSEDEIDKMPLEQQRKMRTSMAEAEKKMEAMSEGKRAAMKARMPPFWRSKGLIGTGPLPDHNYRSAVTADGLCT